LDYVLGITLADNSKVTDLKHQPSPILYEIDSVERTEQLTVVLIADCGSYTGMLGRSTDRLTDMS